MKKENKDKQKLELEIIELENKIAPAVEGHGGTNIVGRKAVYEGAEC